MKDTSQSLHFVAVASGDRSVGIRPLHEEIEVTLKHGGWDSVVLADLTESLRETLKENFEADKVYTKDEYAEVLRQERQAEA